MLTFGRETTGDFANASRLEWLVTNGIGGYASGSVVGANTRRYHGLLVAALTPPTGRTVLVTGLHFKAHYAATGRTFELGCAEWGGGVVAPQGHRLIESFQLQGAVPCWRYALDDGLLEQRIWMAHGSNTTYVLLSLPRASGPIDLDATPLVAYRDYHSQTHGAGWALGASTVADGLRVDAFYGAAPFWIRATGAAFEAGGEWYWNVRHRAETERGLDDAEDVFAAGRMRAVLEPGATLTIVLTTDERASLDGPSELAIERNRQDGLLARSRLEASPPAIRQLVLAADQFVVARPSVDDPGGQSVIAGYHWFADWGRDTMISLPGLALATGRPEASENILRTFARFVDMGMLPNRFPDAGETPEYNTVDATLWYFEAVRAHVEQTGDLRLAADLFPVLADIVAWHVRGTRYGIRVDEADGLLAAGEPGVQLTWMDAKIGDWVVTPRIGKPVEINSLWINALRVMADLQGRLGETALPPGNPPDYAGMAERATDAFLRRFWHEPGGYLYDVVDGPGGDDAALRPNQLFAISLPHGPLAGAANRDQARRVLEACARHLLTSHGLRSLAPTDPAYAGSYGGDQYARDSAYHQGTVWGWLIGPFVSAWLKVYGDADRARALLGPLLAQARSGSAGTLNEIYDGDPPFTPRGCIAQAWTVAEVLRVWKQIEAAEAKR